MLVLGRKPRERILVGDSIILEIKEVRGSTASLLVTSPAGTVEWRIWVKDQFYVDADQTVEVYVVSIDRDNVRLGITAPKDVAIHREEIARKIAAEGRRGIVRSQPGSRR